MWYDEEEKHATGIYDSAVSSNEVTFSMGIEIQFCMADYADDDSLIQDCTEAGCDGLLYYPGVTADDIEGNMDTFHCNCRCTECDEYRKRNNTAPRYLRWRVVVRT